MTERLAIYSEWKSKVCFASGAIYQATNCVEAADKRGRVKKKLNLQEAIKEAVEEIVVRGRIETEEEEVQISIASLILGIRAEQERRHRNKLTTSGETERYWGFLCTFNPVVFRLGYGRKGKYY